MPPGSRLAADLAAMVTLPPVTPALGWQAATRLARDHYVRVASCDYSVHPSAIGRLVEVCAGLDQVTVTCGGRLVARHDRCWAPHQTITYPARQQAAAAMRRARLRPAPGPADTAVEQRRLSDYDALLGVEGMA